MKNKFVEPEWLTYIKGHLNDDPFSLSLASKNEKDPFIKEVIQQIQSRQKATKKLPSFAQNYSIIFPPPVSVEQASSELTANFKSKLFHGKMCADLTGGMGIDTIYFSKEFDQVLYVEANKELCEIAEYNFKQLNLNNISVVNQSAEAFLKSNQDQFDLIYLDPSRRDSQNKKIFKIEESVPNILELEDQLIHSTKSVLIKLSPLADLKMLFRQLTSLNKIWVVSVKNDCREILCELNNLSQKSKSIIAINIESQEEADEFSFDFDEEENAEVKYALPAGFIYEPNSSILKSGAFKTVGLRYQLAKLALHSHLYTSIHQINFTGRIFKLLSLTKPDKKALTTILKNKKVNVITRNYPLKPEEIIKKFKLKSGDDQYLIATTLLDKSKVFLICDRIK